MAVSKSGSIQVFDLAAAALRDGRKEGHELLLQVGLGSGLHRDEHLLRNFADVAAVIVVVLTMNVSLDNF